MIDEIKDMDRKEILTVGRLKYKHSNGELIDGYTILKNMIPIFEVSQWLEFISANSIKTGEKYAYSLLQYLRFLHTLGLGYKEVTSKEIIKGYINHLLYGTEDNKVHTMKPQRSFQSVLVNLSIVSSFYTWLEGTQTEFVNPLPKLPKGDKKDSKKGKQLKKGYLYGQIWNTNYDSLLRSKFRFKPKRNHTKWYTDDEKEALISNFECIRDKVIFLISLEGGCRINEILTLKYENYNYIDKSIYIHKSKTFSREVVLPQYVCDELDRYISTERQIVEAKHGICEPMFINLKEGKWQGRPLTYRNYWEILKRCAVRAGLNPEKIITHAGRSTRAQELVESQILHPELGISETYIMDIMGWSSIDSLKPYKKQLNTKIQKKIVEKVEERKRLNKERKE